MTRGESNDVVSRARQGDESAWAELYAAHGRRLLVWLHTIPSADAAIDPEDLAAEAWLTAASKIADFSGSSSDFAGWLFTIGRNISSSRRRTAARRRTTPVPADDKSGDLWTAVDDPAREVGSTDSTRRLLAHLSEREAQVVACIDVVGLDVATTAVALDMSATAVRVAHHRAMRRLRRLLSAGTEESGRKGRGARVLPRGRPQE